VIATTTGGSVELFRDNVNALTFKAGDHEDLSRQILALQAQPELRRRVAAAGCAQVRKELREEIVMDRVEGYVRDTVAGWPSLVPRPLGARKESKSLVYA
jgi:glycosyltransferase involved in cell wall biosynthesis